MGKNNCPKWEKTIAKRKGPLARPALLDVQLMAANRLSFWATFERPGRGEHHISCGAPGRCAGERRSVYPTVPLTCHPDPDVSANPIPTIGGVRAAPREQLQLRIRVTGRKSDTTDSC